MMAIRPNRGVEDVLQILSAEDTEDDDLDWNISEASQSDDEIDFQPVWEVSEPLNRREEETVVLEEVEKSLNQVSKTEQA